MIFGIDGIDQKTALHRKNQKFDESWYAMTYCKQNLNPKNSLVAWQFISKYNQHEIQQAKQLAKQHKIRFLTVKKAVGLDTTMVLDPPDDENPYSTNIQSTREFIRYDSKAKNTLRRSKYEET